MFKAPERRKMDLADLEQVVREYRIQHGLIKTIADLATLLRAMLSADTANLRAATVEHGEPSRTTPYRVSLAQSLTCTVDDAKRTIALEARL